jgi:hypothetical protein
MTLGPTVAMSGRCFLRRLLLHFESRLLINGTCCVRGSTTGKDVICCSGATAWSSVQDFDLPRSACIG